MVELCKRCLMNKAEFCEPCYTKHKIQLSRIFKNKVWQNAKNKCQLCGITDERVLTVHHLDIEHFPYNATKAMLLCFNCHSLQPNHGRSIIDKKEGAKL